MLNDAQIVCTTLSCAGYAMFNSLKSGFDTVLVDEAAQAVEVSSLIPLKCALPLPGARAGAFQDMFTTCPRHAPEGTPAAASSSSATRSSCPPPSSRRCCDVRREESYQLTC